MTDENKPTTIADIKAENPNVIEMTHDRMFCARHGEPFRENWPAGGLLFQVIGMKEYMLGSHEFCDAASKLATDRGDTSDRAFQNAVESLLDTVPMCCRLTLPHLLELYLKSEVAKLYPGKRCELCGKAKPGTPYRIGSDTGIQRLEHLCFECLVFRTMSTLG